MMKQLFTLLTFSVVTLAVGAQQPLAVSNVNSNTQTNNTVAAANTADVLFLRETEFDFGKIPQGKPVTHIFEVINNSKDTLRIVNIQASCGCTTPEWDRDKIQAPGERTKITVGYNAASEGAFTKPITITYNGTQTKQLTIRGEVWKTPVSSAPENKALENLKD